MLKEKIRHCDDLRIMRFYNMIEYFVFAESCPLTLHFRSTGDEFVPYSRREEGGFKEISVGTCWSQTPWESAWFHVEADVPEEWKGQPLALNLDFSGEALLFDRQGVPRYGLCHGSVFDAKYTKTLYLLSPEEYADGRVDFWIEASASNLSGVDKKRELPSGLTDPPMSSFTATVLHAELCRIRPEVMALRSDMQILTDLLKSYPPEDYRARRIIRALRNADVVLNDDPENAAAAREVLQEILSLPAEASALAVTAVGHAHIDIAWYWRMRESIRKSARTFASQLYNMEHYPDYVFGASQPHNYATTKEHYPELYEKIREQVKAGRWELQGGMWVEADCNVISGESMVRQFLHGKNFFMDEFGVEVKSLWLPDVFGYSASMPQIIRLARCDSFVTQKISWSQYNKFPHHTFNWQGIDGTEVFTHFPPEDTYNADLRPEQLRFAQNNFAENDFIGEFLSLYGIGDGGGGPAESYLERGLRMKNLEGVPKVQFGKAGDFLRRVREKHGQELARWTGELYLELHRGTLTTQASVKRYNRKNEQAFAAAETIAAMLPFADYPAAELDALWKKFLSLQFHDILPGSSINEVYIDTNREMEEIAGGIEAVIRNAAVGLFAADENCAVVFNTLGYPFEGVLELPTGWNRVADDAGELPAQQENGKILCRVSLPPFGIRTLHRIPGELPAGETDEHLVLENAFVRYEFDRNGVVTRAVDLENGREILQGPGNRLALYTDRPANPWNEAWDVDIFLRDFPPEYPQCTLPPTVSRGCVRDSITFHLKVSRSTIRQSVSLEHTSKLLTFDTEVEWNEDRKLLQTEFCTGICSQEAVYDIQYGFVKRPTHTNTSWDWAKFEMPTHRYVDLSDDRGGAALLNDCKYACTVRDGNIMMSLIRSPKYPDYFADLGHHRFSYGWMPHGEGFPAAGVIAAAACFNRKPLLLERFKAENTFSCPIQVPREDNISVEVVKKAEKKEAMVIRLVEIAGRFTDTEMVLPAGFTQVSVCDLLEWEEQPLGSQNGVVKLEFHPFEIKTLLLRMG